MGRPGGDETAGDSTRSRPSSRGEIPLLRFHSSLPAPLLLPRFSASAVPRRKLEPLPDLPLRRRNAVLRAVGADEVEDFLLSFCEIHTCPNFISRITRNSEENKAEGTTAAARWPSRASPSALSSHCRRKWGASQLHRAGYLRAWQRRRVAVIGPAPPGRCGHLAAVPTPRPALIAARMRPQDLISGGARSSPAGIRTRFVTDSSPQRRNMLRSWPLPEQIRFFESELSIPLAEEPETGKLFPASNRARDVRDGLLALARRRGVELLAGAAVTGLQPEGGGWRILRQGSPPLEADAVVVATGGLSVPKSGSDGIGLSILEGLGHTLPRRTPPINTLKASPSPTRLAASLFGGAHRAILRARRIRIAAAFSYDQGYSGPRS